MYFCMFSGQPYFHDLQHTLLLLTASHGGKVVSTIADQLKALATARHFKPECDRFRSNPLCDIWSRPTNYYYSTDL